MMEQPTVDPAQIGRFVHALFRHASEGGFVSLRAFYDDELAKRRGERPFKIRTVRLNGNGLEPVIISAVKLARDAAEAGRPVVVAPPIATFASSKATEQKKQASAAVGRAGGGGGAKPAGGGAKPCNCPPGDPLCSCL